MACKRFEENLTEAALGVLSPEREAELQAHLAVCAACRAAFDERLALASAIDRGIAASVAGEPSPEFAARVRERLREERSALSFGWAGWRQVNWVPAAGVALVAIVLAVTWLGWRKSEQGNLVQPSPTTALPSSPPIIASGPKPELVGPSGIAQPAAPQIARRKASLHPVPEVVAVAGKEKRALLAPMERDVVLRFYAAIWSGEADATTLVQTEPGTGPTEIRITPLDLRPLSAEDKDAKSR